MYLWMTLTVLADPVQVIQVTPNIVPQPGSAAVQDCTVLFPVVVVGLVFAPRWPWYYLTCWINYTLSICSLLYEVVRDIKKLHLRFSSTLSTLSSETSSSEPVAVYTRNGHQTQNILYSNRVNASIKPSPTHRKSAGIITRSLLYRPIRWICILLLLKFSFTKPTPRFIYINLLS